MEAEVELVQAQLRVVEPPAVMFGLFAESPAAGAGGGETVTAAEAYAVPPAPEHVRVYVVVLEG
jgi:hypothetical protein